MIYNAHDIEEGLYTRLTKTSCYIFPILKSEYFAIVNKETSKNTAFETATIQAKGVSDIFPIAALDIGAIVPSYSMIAIDTTLKHTLSLSKYPLLGVQSAVYYNAVSRVDAASTNTKLAIEDKRDVIMDIDIPGLPIRGVTEQSFIYKFVFGQSVQPEEIIVPDYITGDSKIKYWCVCKILNDTHFYINKTNDNILKLEFCNGADQLLTKIIEYSPPNDSSNSSSMLNELRENLSILKDKVVCVEKKASKIKEQKESLEELRFVFLEFFKDFLERNRSNTNILTFAINNTYDFLFLTQEKNENNLILKIAYLTEGIQSGGMNSQEMTQPPMINKKNMNLDLDLNLNLDDDEDPDTDPESIAKRQKYGSPARVTPANNSMNLNPQIISPFQGKRLGFGTPTSSEESYQMDYSDKESENELEDTKSVATTESQDQVEPRAILTNYPFTLYDTYTSMIGQYGFYLSSDNGNTILKPIDSVVEKMIYESKHIDNAVENTPASVITNAVADAASNVSDAVMDVVFPSVPAASSVPAAPAPAPDNMDVSSTGGKLIHKHKTRKIRRLKHKTVNNNNKEKHKKTIANKHKKKNTTIKNI